MIRLILVLFAVVAFLILSIPILIVEWLIGKKNPKLRDESSLHIVQFMFRLIQWLAGTKVTVIGEENVPKDIPVLYIGNHRSFFDIVITYARCPRLTGYVAKDSMKKVPLLSVWMERLYCLFLSRSKTAFRCVFSRRAPETKATTRPSFSPSRKEASRWLRRPAVPSSS